MSNINTELNLENKVALVTGASRGIGQAIAKSIGQCGATVIGTATTKDGANNISKFFEENNIKGYGLELNVNNLEQIDSVVGSISKNTGDIAILINNAGITRDNLLLRMKQDEWDSVISTNLTSIYRISKACLRPMMKARWGRIINISSVVGLMGNAGQANYCAAKAGLIGFSKALAMEIGSRGITVNTVAPGFIDTDMTKELPETSVTAMLERIPLGRLGSSNEIANVVLFLASNMSSYITGETINVNGGMYMG